MVSKATHSSCSCRVELPRSPHGVLVRPVGHGDAVRSGHTYFEGDAAKQPLALHEHSKQKRSDCRLLTLGLLLGGSAS